MTMSMFGMNAVFTVDVTLLHASQHRVDMDCTLWPLRQWGDPMSLICTEDPGSNQILALSTRPFYFLGGVFVEYQQSINEPCRQNHTGLFFLSSCTCFSAGPQSSSFWRLFFGPCMVLHVLFILQKNSIMFFFIFLKKKVVLQEETDSKPGPSGVELATNHWHRFRHYKVIFFFFISITFTVKKSNLATEPHGFFEGCTVRPRKGAGQCSMGGGGNFRVSRWAVLAALEVGKLRPRLSDS